MRGATSHPQRLRHSNPHFNPRTPCGVRPLCCRTYCTTHPFQSTHPLRGATRGIPLRCHFDGFQSTHPLRGATLTAINVLRDDRDFNPRTPCGVRHLSNGQSSSPCDFNPRTPCGVRRDGILPARDRVNFNPRTPCGVRLYEQYNRQNVPKFQSTHPLRGATRTGAF